MSAVDANPARGFSRRQFLSGLGGVGLGLALAACSVNTKDSGKASAAAASGDLTIPDAGSFPSGPVTVKFLNGGPGPKSFFFSSFLAAYKKKHPNVKIQYDELPNAKISEVLPLQLRQGNAADLLFIVNVPIGQLASSGKLAPLEDVIPNFTQWKSAFPFGMLVPGVQVFDGKTYAITPSSDRRSTMVLYNKKYIDAAGVDPSAMTYDDFRAAAKKITKQGNGKYYGLILPGAFQGVLLDLAQLGGTRIGGLDGIDWTTGQYNYHADGMVAVVELLQAIKSDGSFFPGFAALEDEESRARMAQGVAGMTLSGPWNFPVWKSQNPDFAYAGAQHPTPSGTATAIGYAVGGSNQFGVYAGANQNAKAVAGDMLSYLATDDGQRAWDVLTGAADPAWSTKALADVLSGTEIDAPNRAALELFDKTVRLMPSPLIANPDAATVQQVLVPAKPNLGKLVQGVLTGQVSDVKKALKKLSDNSEKALDDAITKAKSQGANVSRDDWVFKNWNPTQDYGASDYEGR